jgi:hypothetical protein
VRRRVTFLDAPFSRCAKVDLGFAGSQQKSQMFRRDPLRLVSESPESPKRLAQILLEILELSGSTRASQSESGNDPIELSEVHCGQKQSERRNDKDNNGQRP